MIRDATIDDHTAFVRLFPELGVDDPVPSRERFGAEYVARSLVFDDGEVVGYALYDVLDGIGYIRHLIADPTRRRAGIGRALMERLKQLFVEAGARAWHLNVKPENAAAIALYASCGMAPQHTTHVMRLPRAVALSPSDVAMVELPAERDDELEARFHMLSGILASGRAKPGRRPVMFVRGGALVGAGVWMRAVPGCFPFRLGEPRDAAMVIACLRDDLDAEWIQVSAEGDEPLYRELLRLGAYEYLAVTHMSGSL